jgi:hypothetical protein
MLAFTVNVTNIDNVPMGNLHIRKTDERGPVIATLFKSPAPAAFHVPGGHISHITKKRYIFRSSRSIVW